MLSTRGRSGRGGKECQPPFYQLLGGFVSHTVRRLTSGALYENEYIKVDGEWRLLVLKYRPVWHSKYDVPVSSTPIGFVKFVSGGKYPEVEGGPDEIETPGDRTVWLWPDGNPPGFNEISDCSSARLGVSLFEPRR
jgi:hypothetical protein